MSRTKKYKIDLFTGEGIDDLLNAIEDKKKWLDRKTEELVERLTDYGVVIANAGFMGAAYDGTNDFYVGFEHRGDAHRAVIATGDTVLFVEFGTGVVYPDNHPEAGKNGMVRGAYGLGHGKQRTWAYEGDPGTNGYVHVKQDGRTVVLTHGNPANMPMYNSVKQLEQDFTQIALEVFTQDD